MADRLLAWLPMRYGVAYTQGGRFTVTYRDGAWLVRDTVDGAARTLRTRALAEVWADFKAMPTLIENAQTLYYGDGQETR